MNPLFNVSHHAQPSPSRRQPTQAPFTQITDLSHFSFPNFSFSECPPFAVVQESHSAKMRVCVLAQMLNRVTFPL